MQFADSHIQPKLFMPELNQHLMILEFSRIPHFSIFQCGKPEPV